jgi:hypothetical protein
MAVRIDISKELGDVFEASAGAMYVDSFSSYETI